jgi:integrase
MTTTTDKPRSSKRRGNGEGSIYQRPDGRWVAMLTIGYNANGKRLRKTVYGWTKKEVQDELTRMHSAKLAGKLATPSRMTVAQYLEHWLQNVARPRIANGTFVNYEGVTKNHITPRIGGIALQKLSVLNVQQLYAEMERSGAGPHGRRLAHCVLHRALKDGLRAGVVTRNVCEAVDPPRITRREMLSLNADQAQQLLAAAKGDRFEALYWVAIHAGLRSGEIFALQWADIDLKAGTIAVRRSQSEVNGRIAVKEPKSAKGRRQVKLSADVVDVLLDHRKRMLAEGLASAERVFCNVLGGPLRRGDFHRRSYKPLLEKAGLPNSTRFHDLRHTHATLLLSLGVNPKVVQERLGHSQISVTMDVYSHVLPTMQQDAANQLGVLLNPSNEIGNKVATNAG